MKGHFTSSLSSFRYASTLSESALVGLGLDAKDAVTMVEMVNQIAQDKEYATSSKKWTEMKPVWNFFELFFFFLFLCLRAMSKVDVESLQQYERLPSVADEDKYDILSKFAIVKLNGGVGSTMGLKTPKGLF